MSDWKLMSYNLSAEGPNKWTALEWKKSNNRLRVNMMMISLFTTSSFDIEKLAERIGLRYKAKYNKFPISLIRPKHWRRLEKIAIKYGFKIFPSESGISWQTEFKSGKGNQLVEEWPKPTNV